MRGRARGALLPDTPNKYLLVGEPTNVPECKTFIKLPLKLKKIQWYKKQNQKKAKSVWYQTMLCLGERVNIGRIEQGGPERTTYKGDFLLQHTEHH